MDLESNMNSQALWHNTQVSQKDSLSLSISLSPSLSLSWSAYWLLLSRCSLSLSWSAYWLLLSRCSLSLSLSLSIPLPIISLSLSFSLFFSPTNSLSFSLLSSLLPILSLLLSLFSSLLPILSLFLLSYQFSLSLSLSFLLSYQFSLSLFLSLFFSPTNSLSLFFSPTNSLSLTLSLSFLLSYQFSLSYSLSLFSSILPILSLSLSFLLSYQFSLPFSLFIYIHMWKFPYHSHPLIVVGSLSIYPSISPYQLTAWFLWSSISLSIRFFPFSYLSLSRYFLSLHLPKVQILVFPHVQIIPACSGVDLRSQPPVLDFFYPRPSGPTSQAHTPYWQAHWPVIRAPDTWSFHDAGCYSAGLLTGYRLPETLHEQMMFAAPASAAWMLSPPWLTVYEKFSVSAK